MIWHRRPYPDVHALVGLDDILDILRAVVLQLLIHETCTNGGQQPSASFGVSVGMRRITAII